MRHLLIPLLACLAANASAAPCQPDTPIGSWCDTALTALHPTQGGIGQLQVNDEAASLRQLSADKLAARIRKKAIPVVIGPGGQLYLVDRHHFASALLRVGVREAPVQVIGKLAQADGFWAQMQARHWAWLYNQQGWPAGCRTTATSARKTTCTLWNLPGPAGWATRWAGPTSPPPRCRHGWQRRNG